MNVVNFILGGFFLHCARMRDRGYWASHRYRSIFLRQNVFGIQRLSSKYEISVDLAYPVRDAASTILSGLIGYGTLFLIAEVQLVIQLAIGALVFLISYLISAPLVEGLVYSNFETLREFVNKIPISFPIFDFFIEL